MSETAEKILRSLQRKLPLFRELEKSIHNQLLSMLKEFADTPSEEKLSASLAALKNNFEKMLPYGAEINNAIHFLKATPTLEEINILQKVENGINEVITQIDAAFSTSATSIDPELFLDILNNPLAFTPHTTPSSDIALIEQIDEHISNYLEFLWLLNNIINEAHQLHFIIHDPEMLAKAKNRISTFSDKFLPEYKGWLRLFEQAVFNSEETLDHVVQSFSEYDLLNTDLHHHRPEYLSSRIDRMRNKIDRQTLVLENLKNVIEKIDTSNMRKQLLEENNLLSRSYAKQALDEAKTPEEKAMIILTLQGIRGETIRLGEKLLSKNEQLLQKTLAAQKRLERAENLAIHIMFDVADTETPQNTILPDSFFYHKYIDHPFSPEKICAQHTQLEETIRDYLEDRQTDNSILSVILTAIGRIAQAGPGHSPQPLTNDITKVTNQWLEELQDCFQDALACNNVIIQTIDYIMRNPTLVNKKTLEHLKIYKDFITNIKNFTELSLTSKTDAEELQKALSLLTSFELQKPLPPKMSKISALQIYVENHVALLKTGLHIITELQQLNLIASCLSDNPVRQYIQDAWQKTKPYYRQWLENLSIIPWIKKDLSSLIKLAPTPETKTATILFVELLLKKIRIAQNQLLKEMMEKNDEKITDLGLAEMNTLFTGDSTHTFLRR